MRVCVYDTRRSTMKVIKTDMVVDFETTGGGP